MPAPSLYSSVNMNWGSSGNDPASLSHTIPGGLSNSCLVVAVLFLDTQETSSLNPSAKWGGSTGTSMTRSVFVESTSTSRTYGAAIFTLVNPTAATQDVWVDFSQTSTSGVMWAGVFQNVNQSAPVSTTANSTTNINSTSATATLTAAYTDPSITIAGFAIRDGNLTHTVTGATGTYINQSTGTDATQNMVGVLAYENLSASGSTSITDTWGTTKFGAWVKIELRGVPEVSGFAGSMVREVRLNSLIGGKLAT